MVNTCSSRSRSQQRCQRTYFCTHYFPGESSVTEQSCIHSNVGTLTKPLFLFLVAILCVFMVSFNKCYFILSCHICHACGSSPSVCVDGWFILGAMIALMHHRCAAPPSQSPISLTQARWGCRPAVNNTLSTVVKYEGGLTCIVCLAICVLCCSIILSLFFKLNVTSATDCRYGNVNYYYYYFSFLFFLKAGGGSQHAGEEGRLCGGDTSWTDLEAVAERKPREKIHLIPENRSPLVSHLSRTARGYSRSAGTAAGFCFCWEHVLTIDIPSYMVLTRFSSCSYFE